MSNWEQVILNTFTIFLSARKFEEVKQLLDQVEEVVKNLMKEIKAESKEAIRYASDLLNINNLAKAC